MKGTLGTKCKRMRNTPSNKNYYNSNYGVSESCSNNNSKDTPYNTSTIYNMLPRPTSNPKDITTTQQILKLLLPIKNTFTNRQEFTIIFDDNDIKVFNRTTDIQTNTTNIDK